MQRACRASFWKAIDEESESRDSPSITLSTKKQNKHFPSRWPFVAGLAFSGAIFLKIATGVTGESFGRRRSRGCERAREHLEEDFDDGRLLFFPLLFSQPRPPLLCPRFSFFFSILSPPAHVPPDTMIHTHKKKTRTSRTPSSQTRTRDTEKDG